MFAGVTVITHGRLGHLWGFVQLAADYITERLGGPAEAPQYVLKVSPNSSGNLVTSVTHVNGSGTPQTSHSGEVIVLLDYTSIDANVNYSLASIAELVTDVFKSTAIGGVSLAQLPLRGLSLSRGTGLLDEISKAMGKSGIWVDQETYADPNPVEVMGDAPPTIYDNVAFVDNYWRWDGNPNNSSTNGSPVDGAYNVNVQWLDGESSGWPLRHLVPAGYYLGTIDLSATNGGEGQIYPEWYGNGHPERDETGFIYTSIVGAPRPLSGVWAPSGGTGSRVSTGQEGEQWANITDLAVNGGDSFASGQPLQLKFIQQDRDTDSTATFYLDPDQNPFNNNFAQTLATANFASSSTVQSGQVTGSTTGAAEGKYWLAAAIRDSQGHVRFDYGRQITITSPTQTPPPSEPPPPGSEPPNPDVFLSVDHTLRIIGTENNDGIKICQSPSVSNRLKVNLNGSWSVFVMSSVARIYAYGLGGNDGIYVDERYGPVSVGTRLMGGDGNDRLVGGSGADTLTGDAGQDILYGFGGSDRIYGGDGSDHLIGGNGTDRLYGGPGHDRFVGAKNSELMDFADGDLVQA